MFHRIVSGGRLFIAISSSNRGTHPFPKKGSNVNIARACFCRGKVWSLCIHTLRFVLEISQPYRKNWY